MTAVDFAGYFLTNTKADAENPDFLCSTASQNFNNYNYSTLVAMQHVNFIQKIIK